MADRLSLGHNILRDVAVAAVTTGNTLRMGEAHIKGFARSLIYP